MKLFVQKSTATFSIEKAVGIVGIFALCAAAKFAKRLVVLRFTTEFPEGFFGFFRGLTVGVAIRIAVGILSAVAAVRTAVSAAVLIIVLLALAHIRFAFCTHISRVIDGLTIAQAENRNKSCLRKEDENDGKHHVFLGCVLLVKSVQKHHH